MRFAFDSEHRANSYLQLITCREFPPVDITRFSSYAAAFSCAGLALYALWLGYRKFSSDASQCEDQIEDGFPDGASKSSWNAHVARVGGLSIVLFKVSRMLGTFALLGLTTYSTAKEGMSSSTIIWIVPVVN